MSLLKVDVERAELAVLRGLGPGDWAAVQQVAVEVHDGAGGGGSGGLGGAGADGAGGRLAQVRALLAGAGFGRVVAEQDAALAGTSLHNVYARREAAAAEV